LALIVSLKKQEIEDLIEDLEVTDDVLFFLWK